MEVDLGSFQETVFEVVEVEEHRVAIKRRLRIAVGKVKPVGSRHLDSRQLADGATQQFLLLQRITATSLTASSDSVEQRHGTQVGLNVTQLVIADRKNGRDRQLTISKMLGQVDKGVVLVTTGTHTTYHALALRRGHTIVFTIAASGCQLLHILRVFPTPLSV